MNFGMSFIIPELNVYYIQKTGVYFPKYERSYKSASFEKFNKRFLQCFCNETDEF